MRKWEFVFANSLFLWYVIFMENLGGYEYGEINYAWL